MMQGNTVSPLPTLALLPVGARAKALRLLSSLQGIEDLHRVNYVLRQIYSTLSLITPDQLGLRSPPFLSWLGLSKQKRDDVLAFLQRLQQLNVELGACSELLKVVVANRERCLAELDEELVLLAKLGEMGSPRGSIDALILGAQTSRDEVARDVEFVIRLTDSVQSFAFRLSDVRQSVLDLLDRRGGFVGNRKLFIKLREDFICSVRHCITITA